MGRRLSPNKTTDPTATFRWVKRRSNRFQKAFANREFLTFHVFFSILYFLFSHKARVFEKSAFHPVGPVL